MPGNGQMTRLELQMSRSVFYCTLSGMPADGSALAAKMTMTTFHGVAIAAALLLAVPQSGFAAKRVSDTKAAAKSKSHASKSNPSAIRSYGRNPYPYSRDPYPYRGDPDPYAYGVNWPKGA